MNGVKNVVLKETLKKQNLGDTSVKEITCPLFNGKFKVVDKNLEHTGERERKRGCYQGCIAHNEWQCYAY